MKREFEFDPKKSALNKEKHGIDFFEAQVLWLDENGVENSSEFAGEPREILISRMDDMFWTAIFTLRGDKIRIISVRRSRKDEIKRYEEANSKGI